MTSATFANTETNTESTVTSSAITTTTSSITKTTTSITTTTHSSTSTTTNTSPSTTTSPTTTTATLPFPFPSQLLRGRNDFIYKFSDYSGSFVISQQFSEFYFFGGIQNTFQVYSNGYLLFGDNDYSFRNGPLTSSSQWTLFSYVAPLWTETIFNRDAFIVYGQYSNKNTDADLFSKVQSKLNKNIDAIFLITWLNVQPSSSISGSRVSTTIPLLSYQIVIAYDGNTQSTYMYFNYQPIQDIDLLPSNPVLIGYQTKLTNGSVLTNTTLSSSFDSSISSKPFSVLNGNINIIFDVSYINNDQCYIWSQKTETKAIKKNIESLFKDNKVIHCPCTLKQASLNRKFMPSEVFSLCFVPRSIYGNPEFVRQVIFLNFSISNFTL